MFVVNLDKIVEAYQALKEQKIIIKQKIDELSRVSASLRSLSGMEEILKEIQRIQEELRKEYEGLQQMMQVLDKAAISYQSCENRIIDEYEEATIHFKKSEVGFTNLKQLNEVLSDLKFK